MSEPHVTVDPKAEAAYVYLHDGVIARTVEMEHGILLDFDADNRIIGVELLNFKMDVQEEDR